MSAVVICREAELWLNEDPTRTVTIRTHSGVPITRARIRVKGRHTQYVEATYPSNGVMVLVDIERIESIVLTEAPEEGEEL